MENQDNNSEENLPKENIKQEQIVQIIETKTEKNEPIKETFFEKFRTFFLDIAVVVIGVTLSTLLNDQITNHNQQKDVRKFLLGLKADFINDIKEMEEDKKAFYGGYKLFNYIKSIKKGGTIDTNKINNIGKEFLFNTTGLLPNNSRYEGFKSAGKMGAIENDSLHNDILDLYQEDIVSLLSSTDNYEDKKRKFINYIEDNEVRETDATSNLYKLLLTEKGYHICENLDNVAEIISRYDICINKMKKIISDIDKQYK